MLFFIRRRTVKDSKTEKMDNILSSPSSAAPQSE